jgi:N-methylhydantoinase A
VIVPPRAGVRSAYGLLVAPLQVELSEVYLVDLEEVDFSQAELMFARMEGEAKKVLMAAGAELGELQITRFADMRYIGQGYEIVVPIPTRLSATSGDRIKENFDTVYLANFGHLNPDAEMEAVTWRIVVSSRQRPLMESASSEAGSGHRVDHPVRTRQVYFPQVEGPIECRVMGRAEMSPGLVVAGPLLIESVDCTTVIEPGMSVSVDDGINLVIKLHSH